MQHAREIVVMGAVLAGLAVLAGCPSSEENAPTVWLALDGRETEVKLIDQEPLPY